MSALVVQAELRSADGAATWITMGWFPLGVRLAAQLRRDGRLWTVAAVYGGCVRDLDAEREWK